MSRKEWYEMYLRRGPQPAGGTKASQRTFERMYRGWKKHLRIAARIQMGTCVTCENLKKAIRRQSLLPEHKEEAAQSQRLHVEAVLRDRRADNLIQGMAEESLMVADTAVRWDRTILNFDVDWMDQAKFRVPRNVSMNKQFSDMWRPQLGAGGITMDGIGSFVFLTDVDLGKNADIQLTMISRALEVASEELAERGVPMPAHLRCVSDNATGETKNNSVFLWMCWLVARRNFLTGMLCQGRVGHTHGREDQQFSTMAKGLRRSEVLQDPGDFATRIRETLRPCARRRLAIEQLNGALRWRVFFCPVAPTFSFPRPLSNKSSIRRG